MGAIAEQPRPVRIVTTRRPCPVCGSGRGELLHQQPFVLPAGSLLPDVHAIVGCGTCGMVFADAQARQVDFDAYYARGEKYADETVGTGGGRAEHDRARIEALVDRLELHVPRDARVVDLGCAGGGVLSELRRRGHTDLLGIDPSPACVQKVQARGINARTGSFADLTALAGAFDLLLLSHVLEHVWDVASVVAAVTHAAKRGARLYAEVPNASRYGCHGHVPFYFFDPEHVNHFDARCLAGAFTRHGWESIESGCIDLPLPAQASYPATWCMLGNSGQPAAPTVISDLPGVIGRYVAACVERGGFAAIEALARHHRPVVLWGAGSFARRLLATTPLARCALLAIIDSDPAKQGNHLAGHRIRAPSAARFLDAPILVCAAVGAPSVVAQIRALGLDNEIILPDGAPPCG